MSMTTNWRDDADVATAKIVETYAKRDAEIESRYLEGASLTEIGHAVGLHATTIGRILAGRGMTLRGRGRPRAVAVVATL